MKQRLEYALQRAAWCLGLTYSPSRYFIDGHGYSWIGKKVRRLEDHYLPDDLVYGAVEGRKRVRPEGLEWSKSYMWRINDGKVEIYED